MPDPQLVTGHLKDLGTLNLGALPSLVDPALAEMLDRVVARMDKPGASISGYNGASGSMVDETAAGAVPAVVELPADDGVQ